MFVDSVYLGVCCLLGMGFDCAYLKTFLVIKTQVAFSTSEALLAAANVTSVDAIACVGQQHVHSYFVTMSSPPPPPHFPLPSPSPPFITEQHLIAFTSEVTRSANDDGKWTAQEPLHDIIGCVYYVLHCIAFML